MKGRGGQNPIVVIRGGGGGDDSHMKIACGTSKKKGRCRRYLV